MADDSHKVDNDTALNTPTSITKPYVKRPRPNDGSPILDSDEPSVQSIPQEFLQAFQTMLDIALSKQKTDICEAINAKIEAQASKIDEQASRITDLKKATDINTNVINNLRSEVDILRTEHHDKIEHLNSSVSAQIRELGGIKKQVEDLKCEISHLKEENIRIQFKQIDQEARGRRDNLIFYGIPEEKEENIHETMNTFLREHMQISDGSTIIDRAHRQGRPRSGTFLGSNANKPRPVIIKFYRFKEKERVRAKRFDLKPPFSITEDLPLEIRDARKSLLPQLQELKNKGKKPYIVYPANLMCEGRVIDRADPCKFVSSTRR